MKEQPEQKECEQQQDVVPEKATTKNERHNDVKVISFHCSHGGLYKCVLQSIVSKWR